MKNNNLFSKVFGIMNGDIPYDVNELYVGNESITERDDKISLLHEFIANIKEDESIEVYRDFLDKLIHRGADINIKSSSSWITPLHYALMIGNKELIKYLIINGGDIMSPIKTSHRGKEETYSILHLFAGSMKSSVNRFEMLQWIFDNFKDKVDPNVLDSDGKTPIAHALFSDTDDWEKKINLFVNNGADKTLYKGGHSNLFEHFIHTRVAGGHTASNISYMNKINYFVNELGFDINQEDKWGNTIVSIGIIEGQRSDKIIPLLGYPELDIHHRNKNYQSYVDLCILKASDRHDHESVAKYLLKQGVDIFNCDMFGDTTVDRIFYKENTSLAYYLGYNNIDISNVTINGLTLDEYNEAYNIQDVVDAYKRGCDAKLRDEETKLRDEESKCNDDIKKCQCEEPCQDCACVSSEENTNNEGLTNAK